MHTPVSDPAWLAAAVLAAALLVALLAWWRARSRVSRHNRARQAEAQAGEAGAERLLERAGFVVLDRQVTTEWVMLVDDEAVPIRCRADLLVEARSSSFAPRGARFVAEVKTGTRAPDPTHPQTRRQLLEYGLAFEVDGVLLVDMEARRIRTVAFPDQSR